MAAVDSTTVGDVLVYDCREHFVLFGGLWERFDNRLESNSTSNTY